MLFWLGKKCFVATNVLHSKWWITFTFFLTLLSRSVLKALNDEKEILPSKAALPNLLSSLSLSEAKNEGRKRGEIKKGERARWILRAIVSCLRNCVHQGVPLFFVSLSSRTLLTFLLDSRSLFLSIFHLTAMTIRQHCLWIGHAVSLISFCYKCQIAPKMFRSALVLSVSFSRFAWEMTFLFRDEVDATRVPIPPPVSVPRWPCESSLPLPSDSPSPSPFRSSSSFPPSLSSSLSSSVVSPPPLPPLPPLLPSRPPSSDEEYFVRDLRQIVFLLYGGMVEVRADSESRESERIGIWECFC